MLRTQLAALTLAATALAASGCGGSSKGSATTSVAAAPTTTTTTAASTPLPPVAAIKIATGRPLSRARFMAKAEAICAATNAKLSAVTIITGKEYVRELPQLLIYSAAETAELSKLVPPRALAHSWSTLVNDFHLYNEYYNDVARYVHANNIQAARPLVEAANRLQQHVAIIATREGFKHCARRN